VILPLCQVRPGAQQPVLGVEEVTPNGEASL
jgi:hypothetical protein